MTAQTSISKQPLFAGLPERVQCMLQVGENYEKTFSQKNLEAWKGMAKTKNPKINYLGWPHVAHVVYLLFNALNDSLSFPSPAGAISLKNRIEEIHQHQNKTLKEIMTGKRLI